MKRPSLFMTETRLRAAHEALATQDPECEMSGEEAEAFLQQYVNAEAAVECRDDLAEFMREAEGTAVSKRARAQELIAEAKTIEAGLENMGASVVRLMQALHVDELRGKTYRLIAKKSAGSCAVDDEALVPAEFVRTREDDDLLRARRLLAIVDQLTPPEDEAAAELLGEAKALVALSERARMAVDKNEVRKAWKENGGNDRRAAIGEEMESPLAECVNRVEEDGAVTILGWLYPVVPGTHKQVDVSLVIK